MSSAHPEVKPPAQPRPAAEPAPAPSRGRWYIPVALVVLAGAGAAWWWFSRGEKQVSAREHSAPEAPAIAEPSAAASENPLAAHVEVVYPRAGGMERTSAQPGSVHSFEYAELYAKVSGYLDEQKVDIGDRVKKDDLLAKIRVPEVEDEVKRAESALRLSQREVDQAQARLESAKAAKVAAQALVKTDEADLEKAIAQRKYREKEYARIYHLRDLRAIDEKLVDEELDRKESAIAEQHSAEAAVETAKAKVRQAEAEIANAEADREAARARVEVNQAELKKARDLASYTEITSPYTGVVTLRTFHVGDFIRSAAEGGGKPLLRVDRVDKVRVVTQIPDNDVPYLDRGDPAIVTIRALNNEEFKGKVARTADTEDPTTRTMRTEVDLENTSGKLRDGMYGLVTVILEPASKYATIPSASVVTKKAAKGKASSSSYVYVVRNGKATLVPIKTGRDNGIEVEVLEGLTPDDQVITTTSVVTDGQPVVIDETAGTGEKSKKS